jgi:hypothetical protein
MTVPVPAHVPAHVPVHSYDSLRCDSPADERADVVTHVAERSSESVCEFDVSDGPADGQLSELSRISRAVPYVSAETHKPPALRHRIRQSGRSRRPCASAAVARKDVRSQCTGLFDDTREFVAPVRCRQHHCDRPPPQRSVSRTHFVVGHHNSLCTETTALSDHKQRGNRSAGPASKKVVRLPGIEPRLHGWRPWGLPLTYMRKRTGQTVRHTAHLSSTVSARR